MGFEEVVGFGLETTWNSFLAMQHFARPIRNTLKQIDAPQKMPGPSGSNFPFRYSATLPRQYRSTKQIRGNITVEGEYDDIGRYLMNALAEPTSTADSPVASAYTHVFAVPVSTAAANTPKSLSIARLNGVEDWRFLGCFVDVLEIRGIADRIQEVSMDIIGTSGGDAEVDDADTEGYSAAPFMEFHDADFRYHATAGTATGSLASQTGGAALLGWTLRVQNNWRAVPAVGTGSRIIREPIYQGERMITLTLQRDAWDDEFFDKEFPAAEPGAYGAFEMKLTSDEFITGSTPYDLALYCPYGVVMGTPTEYGGGADILPETVTIELGTNGTASPLTATLINGTTNASGAAYGGSQT
jgi:hypothetical protein